MSEYMQTLYTWKLLFNLQTQFIHRVFRWVPLKNILEIIQCKVKVWQAQGWQMTGDIWHFFWSYANTGHMTIWSGDLCWPMTGTGETAHRWHVTCRTWHITRKLNCGNFFCKSLVWVLLSAHVKKFGVSRTWDFYIIYVFKVLGTQSVAFLDN